MDKLDCKLEMNHCGVIITDSVVMLLLMVTADSDYYTTMIHHLLVVQFIQVGLYLLPSPSFITIL